MNKIEYFFNSHIVNKIKMTIKRIIRLQFSETSRGKYAICMVSGNNGLYYTVMPFGVLHYYGNNDKYFPRDNIFLYNNLISSTNFHVEI